MKNKKALAGILLSVSLAGGIITPASVAFATDETTSVDPATEVATEATAPAAETPAATESVSTPVAEVPTAEAPVTETSVVEVPAAEPAATEAPALVAAETSVVEASATEAPAPVVEAAPVAETAAPAVAATKRVSVGFVAYYKDGRFESILSGVTYTVSEGEVFTFAVPEVKGYRFVFLSLFSGRDYFYYTPALSVGYSDLDIYNDITVRYEPIDGVTTTEPTTTEKPVTTTEPTTTEKPVTTTEKPAVAPPSNGGKNGGSVTGPKKVLPNTGETGSTLAVIGLVLLSFVGLIGVTHKRK